MKKAKFLAPLIALLLISTSIIAGVAYQNHKMENSRPSLATWENYKEQLAKLEHAAKLNPVGCDPLGSNHANEPIIYSPYNKYELHHTCEFENLALVEMSEGKKAGKGEVSGITYEWEGSAKDNMSITIKGE